MVRCTLWYRGNISGSSTMVVLPAALPKPTCEELLVRMPEEQSLRRMVQLQGALQSVAETSSSLSSSFFRDTCLNKMCADVGSFSTNQGGDTQCLYYGRLANSLFLVSSRDVVAKEATRVNCPIYYRCLVDGCSQLQQQ